VVPAQTITANAYASLVERLTETQETQTQVSILRLLNTLRRIASPAEAEEFVRDFDAKDGRKTFYVYAPPMGASKAPWNAVSHCTDPGRPLMRAYWAAVQRFAHTVNIVQPDGDAVKEASGGADLGKEVMAFQDLHMSYLLRCVARSSTVLRKRLCANRNMAIGATMITP